MLLPLFDLSPTVPSSSSNLQFLSKLNLLCKSDFYLQELNFSFFCLSFLQHFLLFNSSARVVSVRACNGSFIVLRTIQELEMRTTQVCPDKLHKKQVGLLLILSRATFSQSPV